MTTDLVSARNGPARDMAPGAPSPVDSFELLDVIAGGVSHEAPRQEWIATISSGERGPSRDGKPGLPQRSTDGRIFLHDDTGRAPALRAALEATGFKSLTIAFPWDDLNSFIRQRFVQRSATSLVSYGDQHAIRVIETRNGQTTHTEYLAGTDGYARAVASCKVEVSVFFALAEWVGDVPEIVFPDGWGALYRLRFTSRNSLRSIANTLKDVAQFTGGRVRGIPFELRIDYREVADGTGAKRRIPVWVIAMKTPQALRLSSRTFRTIVGGAIDQGSGLVLPPAPSQETLDMAALEAPPVDLDELEISDQDVALLERGGRCDAAHYEKTFFAIVDGTDLDGAEARASFLWHVTGQRFSSLSGFLAQATDAEAQALINEVAEYVLDRKKGHSAGVVLPSAVDTGTLTRNQFIALAMERYGYDGKLAIAKALGLVTLNAWTAGGERTWNDALAELDRIETAQELLDQPESLTPQGPPTVAEYEESWLSEDDPDDDPGEDEPQAAVQDDEPTAEFDALLLEHEQTQAQGDAESPLSGLHALWQEYQQLKNIAQNLNLPIGPEPPKRATIAQLRGFIGALGRKVEQAQAQGSLV